jgi:hypothetical protein
MGCGYSLSPCINASIKLLSNSKEEHRQGFEKGSTGSNLLVTEADANP